MPPTNSSSRSTSKKTVSTSMAPRSQGRCQATNCDCPSRREKPTTPSSRASSSTTTRSTVSPHLSRLPAGGVQDHEGAMVDPEINPKGHEGGTGLEGHPRRTKKEGKDRHPQRPTHRRKKLIKNTGQSCHRKIWLPEEIGNGTNRNPVLVCTDRHQSATALPEGLPDLLRKEGKGRVIKTVYRKSIIIQWKIIIHHPLPSKHR